MVIFECPYFSECRMKTKRACANLQIQFNLTSTLCHHDLHYFFYIFQKIILIFVVRRGVLEKVLGFALLWCEAPKQFLGFILLQRKAAGKFLGLILLQRGEPVKILRKKDGF